MKKRLRKKKHLGEFQQFGFEIDATLRPDMGREASCAFVDRFITHIETSSLALGGGIGTTVTGFVTRWDRTSASERDLACVTAFFASDPDVVQHEIGGLRDAWYE